MWVPMGIVYLAACLILSSRVLAAEEGLRIAIPSTLDRERTLALESDPAGRSG